MKYINDNTIEQKQRQMYNTHKKKKERKYL